MSPLLQNLLVLAAVGACVFFMLRGAYRALHGRKSRLSGCGACSGCGTTEAKPKPTTEQIVMVPMDALIRTGNRRSANKIESLRQERQEAKTAK